MAAETKVDTSGECNAISERGSLREFQICDVLQEEVGLATEEAKEAVVSAQEYVKLKIQELQDLKHEIEAKRALGSDEEKAASITEFHEKVMIIQHEIAQTVEQANAGVQKVRHCQRKVHLQIQSLGQD